MPLQETSGTASYDAFGGGAAVAPVYIEDVYSTFLYTGNSSTQTINNGIDLAGKGGLVWIKSRSAGSQDGRNQLFDTGRGIGYRLISDSTAAQTGPWGTTLVYNLSSTGFTVGNGGAVNYTGENFASWTFRKQPKFFDVVTWTGNGVYPRNIPHNLGSVPGCIIVKDTSFSLGTNWLVYHQDMGAAQVANLNLTNAFATSTSVWNATSPTATQFTVGSSLGNTNGNTYVAYLFAHNAGGFGLTGTDNVISCGSYTGNGSTTGPTVTLGYEPQYLMIKNASGTGNWQIIDNMRGMPVGSADATLQPNLSSAESSVEYISPTATGFQITSTSTEVNTNTSTYIYIAIRRGPMKTPTSGTSVFAPIVSTASTGTALTTGFPVDMQFPIALAPTYTISNAVDRLRGVSSTTTASGKYLEQSNTNAEASGTVTRNWGNTGFEFPDYFATLKTLFLNFRRAPGFFDEVCYTGTNSGTLTNTHNLGVTPELMIGKNRGSMTNNTNWYVYHKDIANSGYLNLTNAFTDSWRIGNPTATTFDVRGTNDTSSSLNFSTTYVAYLFASCPGVSKVGSYTGTGATQTISCGFAARFVMIKRTDGTGNWFVWDTARGMVAGTDPRLALNSTAAEVNANWVYTNASGFQIVTTDATVNASGGSYIYLCIA